MARACSTCRSWSPAAPSSARRTSGRSAEDAEIVHAPREFPEYGEHYATYFLDPHGFMLEVVCFGPDES